MEDADMPDEGDRLPPRILVVDDESSVRSVAEQVLKLAGYEVEAAEDGFEALEILHSGATFDLLLLDVSMPQMNGVDLLAKLSESNIYIPTLLMSGHAEAEIQQAADQGLVKGILTKPFGIQDLRQAVADLL